PDLECLKPATEERKSQVQSPPHLIEGEGSATDDESSLLDPLGEIGEALDRVTNEANNPGQRLNKAAAQLEREVHDIADKIRDYWHERLNSVEQIAHEAPQVARELRGPVEMGAEAEHCLAENSGLRAERGGRSERGGADGDE